MLEHNKLRPEFAVYTRRVLRIYDGWVLGISNRLIWKCPTARLLALYDQYVSGNHLEIGVGTGLFLDRCRFPAARPRVVLFDANRTCLDWAARRIARYGPTTLQGNVMQSIDAPRSFDSVGMNYVLHCLPGPMAGKTVAIRHAAALLNPGGVLFGSTILSGGVRRERAARWLMAHYNARGIFSNRTDDLDSLRTALGSCFRDPCLTTVGCVAIFAGRKEGAGKGDS
jgi:2-polyprenyl-3-methyl-5-hydroxy-6-metoxy-1,4-benzoquinol methylase